VSVTRASHDLKVFVDDPSKLKQALMRRSGDNTEALTVPELARTKERMKDRKQSQVKPRGLSQFI
jgi:hypothetical protein